MKKSTILIITAVFLISVFVVGIFGLQNVPYDQIVYIEKITPTSVTLDNGATSPEVQYYEARGYYYIIIPYESYQQGMSVIINYDINPTDATNKRLNVTVNNINPAPEDVDPSTYQADNPYSQGILQDNGAIKLEGRGIVEVVYSAQDQSGGATMTFRIRIGKKSN